MKLEFGYGKGVQTVEVADKNLLAVLTSNPMTHERGGEEAVRHALENPIGCEKLQKIVRPGQKVAIVTSDISRPLPTWQIMPSVLDELYSGSIPAAKNFQSVAIYCTHTDESYVPTSGTESKHGGGDILDVAETMVVVLEEAGVPVLHSENLHDPHDVNAYQRSRKTASQLLQEAPAAMIDVHRDGIPDPEYYATTLDGKSATQIRIVVGRQNQNSEANIAFAEKMKAYYDDVKPGLIKSIFMAKGNYNQDLAPNSVLLEIGTHTNTLEAAKNGAKEFAEVLPQFLGLKASSDKNTASDGQLHDKAASPEGETGMGKSVIWLLLAVVIGGGIFLFISQGKGRV